MAELRLVRADSPELALPGLVRQLGAGEGCVFCAALAFSSGLRERLASLGWCVCNWPAAVPEGLAEFMSAVRDLIACEPGATKCRACQKARRDAVVFLAYDVPPPGAPCPAHALCAAHRLTA
jgi:hypothetical protein